MTMENLIGSTLQNRFKVLSFVASGGMSTVFRVRDTQRNVTLAMKVLHLDLMDDPSASRHFQREARALQRLAHPNIVPFYGLYQEEDLHFLLELFVDGPSLKDILRKKKGKLSLPEVLIIFKALCAALGYAHANGVVHCDVKPGNVMIDRSGQVFLTDFGVARHAESTTTTIGAAGTPAYMAPEQIRGEPVNAATDVYALGVLMYEMLTGRRPFTGAETDSESSGATAGERVRLAHLSQPAKDPHQLNPDITPGLSAVVLKALEKAPQQRYQNAQQFFYAACATLSLDVNVIPDRLILNNLDDDFDLHIGRRDTETSVRLAEKRVEKKTKFESRNLGRIGSAGLVGIVVGLIFIVISLILIRSGKEKQISAQISIGNTTTAISYKATTTDIAEKITATSLAEKATTTAIAEKATATALAQKATSTAVAQNATATALTKRATTTAQTYISLVNEQISSGNLLAEIEKGELDHHVDDFLEVYWVYEDITDFILIADFENPYPSNVSEWSYGFLFRSVGGNDQYRLSILSDKTWLLQNVYPGSDDSIFETIASGGIDDLEVGGAQTNQVVLAALGDEGYLIINQRFIAEMDLSARPGRGDVSLAIGFLGEDEVEGQVTGFKNVALYSTSESHADMIYQEIFADQDWQNSGVIVNRGDIVRITYFEGFWSPWSGEICTALGVPETDPIISNIVTGVLHASLIGMIGNGAPFYVGDQLEFVADEEGSLYLRINDTNLEDNAGSIYVGIEINP